MLIYVANYIRESLSLKRYHDKNCDDEPEAKHPKHDANEEELIKVAETSPAPKSLSNIHYDCLERIFDFLNLQSLLNVENRCICQIHQ